MTPQFDVEVGEDFISIFLVNGHTKHEVLYWDQQEWEDDPEVTTAIANAIKEAYTDPQSLYKFVKNLKGNRR